MSLSLSLFLSFCYIPEMAAQKYVYKWTLSKELSRSLSGLHSRLLVEGHHLIRTNWQFEIPIWENAVTIHAAAATQVSIIFPTPGLYKVKVLANVISESTGSGRQYVVDRSFLQVTESK